MYRSAFQMKNKSKGKSQHRKISFYKEMLKNKYKTNNYRESMPTIVNTILFLNRMVVNIHIHCQYIPLSLLLRYRSFLSVKGEKRSITLWKRDDFLEFREHQYLVYLRNVLRSLG